jgi:hypothetical protein
MTHASHREWFPTIPLFAGSLKKTSANLLHWTRTLQIGPSLVAWLDFLERRLMESRTAVIIPFDDGIIFVGSLHRAEFSSRLPEVSQTLNAISWIQFLVGGRELGKRWLLGTVSVSRCAGVWQGRLSGFAQLGHPMIADMGHVFTASFGQSRAFAATVIFSTDTA